jgi:hypothetical protein
MAYIVGKSENIEDHNVWSFIVVAGRKQSQEQTKQNKTKSHLYMCLCSIVPRIDVIFDLSAT